MADAITIMGIYAHPADLATEGAGTMAIHADRGDTVIGIVLSDGIRMHPHFLLGEGDRAPMTLPAVPRVQARGGAARREDPRLHLGRVHGLG